MTEQIDAPGRGDHFRPLMPADIGDSAAVVATIVDNAGVTRAKVIPARRLLAGHDQVGLSETLGVYLVDDSLTESKYVHPPTGDLRLRPAHGEARRLPGSRQLWWAPADQLLPDGTAYAGCQRAALKRAEAATREAGLEVQIGIEAEWMIDDGTMPDIRAPAYSALAAEQHSRYIEAMLSALDRGGLPVEQMHAEYGPGQFEVSLAPVSALTAADNVVLLRQMVRRVSFENGMRASFSPLFQEDAIGSGAHVHMSIWSEGANVMTGGHQRHGMQAAGEAFIAGLLDHAGALTAVVAPSLVSRLRLTPSKWSGAYACWGRENREASLRLVTGSSANVEVKTVDASGNPYLVMASLIAAGLSGIARDLTLPAETTVDPAKAQAQTGRIKRLPATSGEAVCELEKSELLRTVFGELLFENYLAVRQAEHARLGQMSVAELISLHRWRY